MPKVYVIDDSLSVCFAIERMLTARGLDVVSERSGQAALRQLETVAPDLVLCDLVLPDIDGFEICRALHEHPTLREVPVVVISGIIDEEIRGRAEGLGAVGVLKKPFATDELVDLVERVLGSAEAEATGETVDAPPPPPPPPDAARTDDRLLAELEARLEPLIVLEALRFACIVSPDGQIVGFGPNKPDPAAVAALPELARLAALSTFRLGHGDLGLTTVESDHGIVAILPQERDHLLVVGLGDSSVLGKARFLLRRLRAEVA
ncbi:MAG: response regulator [Acidobacteriota bacterium]